jgi:uncharacterized protein with HEPN domain
MKREIKLCIEDILESIEKIQSYSKNKSEKEFGLDSMLQDACVARLEIIGEAVKNISPESRAKYYNVPWKEIAGLRDVLSHAYFNINVKRLWNVIHKDIPDLKIKIQQIFKEL